MTRQHFCRLIFALLTATAPLPPVCAQELPVYLILPGKDGDALVRVAGGKLGEPIALGDNVLYGVTKGKLATIGTIGDKVVLQIYDAATKKVTLRIDLAVSPMCFAGGPQEQIRFSPGDDRLRFIGREAKKDEFDGFSLCEFNLDTRKLQCTPLKMALGNPCLVGLPDAVGIYGVRGCHHLHSFSWQGKKGEQICSDVGDEHTDQSVAKMVFVPGAGVVRVGRDGTLVRALDAKLEKEKDGAQRARQGEIVNPVVAKLDGKAVLVWGERPARDAAITRLVVYDPLKGKTLWGHELPFGAETFAVSGDCKFFYLINRDKPALVQLNRATAKFSPIATIEERPIIGSAAAILIPEQ